MVGATGFEPAALVPHTSATRLRHAPLILFFTYFAAASASFSGLTPISSRKRSASKTSSSIINLEISTSFALYFFNIFVDSEYASPIKF